MQTTNETKGWIMRNLLTIAVLLLTASVAFARNPKFGHDLDRVNPKSTVHVIIQYDHVPTEPITRGCEARVGC